MKLFARKTQGVTLLEIMLVLAVAAMIIVLSIRYYQAANTSQQANAAMQLIQSVTAASDSLSQATGSYSTITTSTLKAILPASGMAAPWGGAVTVTGTATTITLTLPAVPSGVCAILTQNVKANANYTLSANCGTVTYKHN